MTKTHILSGFLLMCCSSAHMELVPRTYGAKAPHIWSWGLAHMELMVDIYRIKDSTPYDI